MRVWVYGPQGSANFSYLLNDDMDSFIEKVSNHFKIDPSQLKLFYDTFFEKPIKGYKGKIMNCLGKPDKLFIQYSGTLPNADICKKTSKDLSKKYLDFNDMNAADVKNISSQWGPNAISLCHFKHLHKNDPIIDKRLDSSCRLLIITKPSLDDFTNISLSQGFKNHRITFLFGRIDEIRGKATVHCSYEPEQTNYLDHVEFNDDFTVPLKIADLLGMKCIGMAISHKPPVGNNEKDKYFLTSYMVKLAATYQNKFGEYFTTLIISPANDLTNSSYFDAFQVKDGAMKLQSNDDLVLTNDFKELKFRKEINVYNVITDHCDVFHLLCNVGVKQFHGNKPMNYIKSKIPLHDFPHPSQFPDIKDFALYDESHQKLPTWTKFFNFQLLCYMLSNLILSEYEMINFIDCIVHMKEPSVLIMDQIENFVKENL